MARAMDSIALISGGKDSTYALDWALKNGFSVKNLVMVIAENEESYMYHITTKEIADLISYAIGIPLVSVFVSKKDDELEPLKKKLCSLSPRYIISGAVRSNYQKKRIDKICREIHAKHIAPLWHCKPLAHLKNLIANHYEIIITSVSAEGFDSSWLGRKIDEKCIKELIELNKKYNINIDGEGGEYETLVLYAPFFKKRIVIGEYEKIWHRDSGRIKIKKCSLEQNFIYALR
ncbi:MAG: diphthine--ammonia ligase [Candidatus Thermoplasmatota archaeon]